MVSYFPSFKECNNHLTSDYTKYLMNSIKSEIFLRLPKLEDKEKKLREMVSLNKDSEEYKIFYDSLKQKYVNFIELNYLPDALTDEMYSLFYLWEDNRSNLRNKHFNYALFIKKMIEKTVSTEFDKKIQEKFKALNSQALENYDQFWHNALFDCKFADSTQPSINDLIKYNKDLCTTTSIIITVELFYSKLENDLYTLLINKHFTKRLIFKLEQKSFWIGPNIQPMGFFDDDEWNGDMNRVMNVYLSCSYKMKELQCLSLLADNECNFVLNTENCKILAAVIKRHKETLEVLTTCRIAFEGEDSQLEIIEALKESSALKLVMFKGAKFDPSVMKKTEQFFKKNKKTLNIKAFYLRLSKKCLISGK